MKYANCTEYWLDPDTLTLRGEFERMYQDIDDPWDCLRFARSKEGQEFADMLLQGCRCPRILDLGCGLGGFAAYLAERGRGEVVGIDISTTAVAKASATFPGVSFFVRDILAQDISDLGRFDVIVLSEVLWYVLADLSGVFDRLLAALAPEGDLGIRQFFPREQRFGREVVNGLCGFEAFLAARSLSQIARHLLPVDDGVVLFSVYRPSAAVK